MTAGKYRRPPEIEAELASLPHPTDPGYPERLHGASLEAVVAERRRRAADPSLRRRIELILAERAVPLVRAAAARHGNAPPGEADEVESEAMARFWEAIQGDSFFEKRFNLAMMRIAQQAGKRVRGGKQRARERGATPIGPADPDAPDGSGVALDVPDGADAYGQAEDRMLIEEAMDALGEEQAKAVILHDMVGWPVREVAARLGVSERTLYRRLDAGRAALRREIGDVSGGDR